LSNFVHPDSLNALQRYFQARRTLVATTRASHPGWYLPANELHHQLHLRVDGESLTGWTYERKANIWTALSEVPAGILTSAEERGNFIAATVASQRERGATCLGVVLHIGDEFAITEINPDSINPDDLAELRETIIYDPGTVLDDSTLNAQDVSCRIFPLSANQAAGSFATTVTLSTRHSEFLSAFRAVGEEQNFPIRTLGLSAPLLAVCALPFLLSEPLQKPSIVAFHYPLFTVLAFFSRHGELAALRNLPHHGQRRSGNLRHATTAAAALLEMTDPNLYVLQMASFTSDGVVADLKQAFPTKPVVLLAWKDHPAITGRQNLPLEGLAACTSLAEAASPLTETETFTTLFGEGWGVQDFLPPAIEEASLYPSRKSMLLVRASRPFHAACALLIVALAGWTCFTFISAVQEPEWAFDAAEAGRRNARKAALIEEGDQLSRWDTLLQDRSKAWSTMELLARMFPADSGITLRSCAHTAEPESTAGKSSIGLIKNWTIAGFAKAEAQPRLTELNTREGIGKIFNEVAAVTGNSAFLPDIHNRTLVVSISTVENKRYKPSPSGTANPADETSYPLTFTLNLSQRFEGSDPLALPVASQPKKKRKKP
jgi:hypothetical protein